MGAPILPFVTQKSRRAGDQDGAQHALALANKLQILALNQPEAVRSLERMVDASLNSIAAAQRGS